RRRAGRPPARRRAVATVRKRARASDLAPRGAVRGDDEKVAVGAEVSARENMPDGDPPPVGRPRGLSQGVACALRGDVAEGSAGRRADVQTTAAIVRESETTAVRRPGEVGDPPRLAQ